MMISIRKCDYCGRDYRSDDPDTMKFAQVLDAIGAHRDMCIECQRLVPGFVEPTFA